MAVETVTGERNGDVAVIRLNDPTSLNALSVRMLEELLREIGAQVEGGARALLLGGAGKAFSSGANLLDAAAAAGESGKLDAGAHLRSHVAPLMSRLRDLPIPIVSAVRGAAAGLGCSLALAADIVVAAEGAYFLQAFTRVGLIPDGGATYTLARSIGKARAMEMTLLAEKIPAAKALEWGLINRVVLDEEVDGTALEVATRLARGASVALGLTRRAIWRSLDEPWDVILSEEADAQTRAGESEDVREGVTAFLSRREPAFKGR